MYTLADFGWTSFFATAHADPLFEGTIPVRVMAVHRTMLDCGRTGVFRAYPPDTAKR